MGPVEENHDGGKCPKCNEANIVNMAVHIIINCKPINGARTDETKHFRIRKKLNGTSETDIAKIIVADKSEENMKQPEQIFYQWKQWSEEIYSEIDVFRNLKNFNNVEKTDQQFKISWKKST